MQLDDKSGTSWEKVVLEGGMDIKALSLSQEQMQFLQTLKLLDNIIAAQCFYVPAAYLNLAESGTSESYTNVPAIQTRFAEDAVEPIVYKIAYALSRAFLPSTQEIMFLLLALTAGTPNDKATGAQMISSVEATLANIPRESRLFDNEVYAKKLGISPALVNRDTQPTTEVEEVEDE